jgi:predicted negative regulator of RcsB-dependent stress response
VAAHLTEEEQIEALKRWWKTYGTIVLVAAVVGLGGFFAWNQYQNHRVESARKASVVYEKFAVAVTEFDADPTVEQAARATQLANEVISHDSSSLYADFAALYLAKVAVQSQDYAEAKTQLEKVSNQGTNESVKELASLRLARVQAAAGEVDAALSILSGKPSPAYAAAYAEARGDVLLSQKRLAEARVAYESALQAMGTSQPMRRNLVQLKIDSTLTSADDPTRLPPAVSPHASMPNPHTPAPVAAAEDA